MDVYCRIFVVILGIISIQVSANTEIPYREVKENWALAVQLVENDPDWATWVKRRQDAFDSWSKSFQENSSQKIGVAHNLYNKKTGKMDKWDVSQPNPDLLEVSDLKYKEAWFYFSRMHNFKMILEACRLYRLTGRYQYLNWAKNQILFYAEYYQHWPLQDWNGRSRMMAQSLDEAVIVTQYLVPSLRLLKNDLSHRERSKIHNQLLKPIQKNLSSSKKSVSNIALWHAVARVLIALELEDYSMVIRERAGLLKLLKSGVKDGIWYEGAFGYNSYVLMALSGLLVEGGLRGVSAELLPLYRYVNTLLISPTKFRFDDFSLPNSNNNRKRPRAINLSVYKMLARVIPTKAGVIEHQRTRQWELLLDPVQQEHLSNNLLEVKSNVYKSLGMSVLKSDSWQIFVHHAQATRNHAQHEVSNYELYYKNIPIVQDQGTVSYGSQLHKDYYTKSLAHNVPFIDGREHKVLLKAKRVNFLNKNQLFLEYRKFNTHYVTLTRRFFLKNEVFSDSVSIKFGKNYKEEKKIGIMFHTVCQIIIPNEGQENIRSRQFKFPKFNQYIKPLMLLKAMQKSYKTRLLCSGSEFELRILSKLKSNFMLVESPSTTRPYKRLSIYSESIGGNNQFDFTLKKI